MSFMACKAIQRCCHCSAVKVIDYSLFRICLLPSSPIMKPLMTEQLIKLDVHCSEQYFFFENTQRQKMSVVLQTESWQPISRYQPTV